MCLGGAVLEDLDFAAALSGLTQGAPQKKSVGEFSGQYRVDILYCSAMHH